METTITAGDLKGLLRRRLKLFILLFSLIMLAAMVVAVALPPIYRSQAVIMIEAQQIPDEYVKSTITSYAEQRLEILTREILKFSSLKKIIEDLDLYPDYIRGGDTSTAIQKMKAAVEIEPISSKIGVQYFTFAFVLSYEGKDPQKTFAVTDRLSKLYLEKETATREKQAASTTSFLKSELANLKKQMDEYDAKISEFKQKHIDELPGSTSANLGTLQRLEREMEQSNLRIRSLQDRKIYLKGQLANIEPLKPIQTDSGEVVSNPQERLKTLRLELIRARARLSDKHPDIKKMVNEIEELERQVGKPDVTMAKVKQLNALRTELKEQRASKGDKHPDVVVLTRQVNELANEVDTLINQDGMADLAKQKPDNPAYINLMTQIVSADLEIKNLSEDIANTGRLIKEYQRKIDISPVVEQEYNELTLDYNNAKKRYDDISTKLLQARVGQEMEVQQQGEHFTIADPAFVPTRPYKPNRLAIILLGFVLALTGGFAGVAFREASDHTIKSTNDINAIDGIELLTAMPYTPTDEELQLHRRKKLVLVTGSMGILGVVLIVVDRLIWPLRDVFSIVVDRLSF